MTDTLLTDATLFDPRAGTLTTGVAVRIAGGVITDVSDQPLAPNGADIIDIGGRTLLPGLIDCHVHVNAVRVSSGLAASRVLPLSFIAAAASNIMRGMLLRGFTSVRDAGGADRGLREAVEQDLFTGPRLFISGRAISQTGGHGDFRERIDTGEPCGCALMTGGIGRVADGVPAVQHAVRDEIRLGADQIKIMASGGVASAADPVHFLQYSRAELEAIVDEAERADTYVMAHAYTPPAVSRAVDAGVRTIEHGNLIDEATAQKMAERGVFLVPTLVTFKALAENGAALGFPPDMLAKLERIVAVGTTSLRLAQAAGVKMAYGTDLLGELHKYQSEEFLIRAAALPALDVLRSATNVAAELLRMEGKLGVIAPGAFADIVAVDGNPLDDFGLLQEQGKHLPLIMKAGRVVKNTLQ
ncbi:MAG: amidohydrolase family protein [Acetobacteraceae bacterium]|nr:amidohydrolase family protein [Acetobacteraceae bacterium]